MTYPKSPGHSFDFVIRLGTYSDCSFSIRLSFGRDMALAGVPSNSPESGFY
ncbi:hypothetical protein LINGRAHAP2_LOCUS1589 [Linum grandiflorum]